MIGRASIGNPWIFQQIKEFLKNEKPVCVPCIKERIRICREHLNLSVKAKGERTGILEMRKHFNGYFKGLRNFKSYRISLLQTTRLIETEELLLRIEQNFKE
jgi:tRNA-dihydrouridine synthase B